MISFTTLVYINLSSISAAALVKLQIQMCILRQAKSPEFHGEWANRSNKYVLHIAIHERAI